MLRLIDSLACWWIGFRQDMALRGMPNDFGIRRVEVKDGRVELTAVTMTAAILADEMATFLDENRAENYVEMDMMPCLDRGLKPIRFTVQWARGVSPAQKAARLQKELNELRGRE